MEESAEHTQKNSANHDCFWEGINHRWNERFNTHTHTYAAHPFYTHTPFVAAARLFSRSNVRRRRLRATADLLASSELRLWTKDEEEQRWVAAEQYWRYISVVEHQYRPRQTELSRAPRKVGRTSAVRVVHVPVAYLSYMYLDTLIYLSCSIAERSAPSSAHTVLCD